MFLFSSKQHKLERVCRETGNAVKLKKYIRSIDLKRFAFDDNWTPLHLCSINGFRDCVDVLLSSGASTADTLDHDGSTALMLAAFAGHDDVVSLLLDAGASLTDVDSRGFNSLHYAASGGMTAACSIMLDRGADISLTNNDGYGALHLAACAGHTETVAFILSNTTATIEDTEKKGNSALHMACAGGYVRLVDFLLQAGANHMAMNHRGRKPFDLCRTPNKRDVATIISSHLARLAARGTYINYLADGTRDKQASGAWTDNQLVRGNENTTLYPNAADLTLYAGRSVGAAASSAATAAGSGVMEATSRGVEALAAGMGAAVMPMYSGIQFINQSLAPRPIPELEDAPDRGYSADSDGGVSDADSAYRINGFESDDDSDSGDSDGFAVSRASNRRPNAFISEPGRRARTESSGSSLSGASGWEKQDDTENSGTHTPTQMNHQSDDYAPKITDQEVAPQSLPLPPPPSLAFPIEPLVIDDEVHERLLRAGWGKSSGEPLKWSSPPPRGVSPQRERFARGSNKLVKAEILSIYQQHFPGEVANLPDIFAEWEGREEELLTNVQNASRFAHLNAEGGIDAGEETVEAKLQVEPREGEDKNEEEPRLAPDA